MLQQTLQLYRDSFTGLSRSIWILSSISLINRAGAMVIPFLTIYLNTQLGFSLSQAGIVMTCFGVGSVFGVLLGGKLTDTIGSYEVQFWTLLLTGFTFLTFLYITDFVAVCVLVTLLGLIGDAFRPANKVAVTEYSEPENVTRSFALLRLAINLGFAMGPTLGGILANTAGYNALFWADGLTCIVAAILFRWLLPPPAVTSQADSERTNTPSVPEQSAYQDTTFMLFAALIMMSAFTFLQYFFVMPVFLKQAFMLTEAQIGALMGLNGLMIVLIEMPLVHSIEKSGKNLLSIAIGIFLVGICYVFYNTMDWAGISLVVISLVTLGEILFMPFASTVTAQRAGKTNKGQYMAVYSMSYSLASVAAPMVGLYIAEQFGFSSLWYFLGLIGLLNGLGMLWLKKRLEVN